MITDLTLELYIELPSKILSIAKERNNYIDLLSEEVYSIYYYTDLRKDLENYVRKFNDTKYMLDSKISLPSINVNKIVTSNKSQTDMVSKFVIDKIDREKWSCDFYNCLINLSYKLTFNEAFYIVNTYFGKMTEEVISENLDISRNTLQKIKKSSLVKMYFEFKSNENVNVNIILYKKWKISVYKKWNIVILIFSIIFHYLNLPNVLVYLLFYMMFL